MRRDDHKRLDGAEGRDEDEVTLSEGESKSAKSGPMLPVTETLIATNFQSKPRSSVDTVVV